MAIKLSIFREYDGSWWSKNIYNRIPLAKMVLSETKGPLCEFYVKWEKMNRREKRKMTNLPKEGMPHVPAALSDTFIKGA